MNVFRLLMSGATVTALVLGFSSTVAADDIEIRLQNLQLQLQVRPLAQAGGLLAPAAIEKLKFTAEQKEKFAKIESEYKDKQKAASEKLQETYKSGDREKIKDASQNARADAQKLRTEYLAKIEALLTDEQKKTLEEVKKEQPRLNANPGGALNGWLPVPQVGGQIIPPGAQQKLKLTDEQKKKIEELQKELENKILGVLTEEQKKQYEELKKQPTQPLIVNPTANPLKPGSQR